jgi:hypothetical protein
MAAAGHYFPVFETLLASKAIDLTTDTLEIGLIASGTFTFGATPQGYEFVSQFLAGDGTDGALTEVSTSGTGYARQALTSVTFARTGENVILSAANPSFAAATFSTVYGFLLDSTVGTTDATHPILAYFDWGGAQSVSGATFTLTIGASGLLEWSGS